MEDGFCDDKIRLKYFPNGNTSSRCKKHSEYNCDVCVENLDREIEYEFKKHKEEKEMEQAKTCQPGSIIHVPVDIDGSESGQCKRARSIESFSRQIEYIKEILGYDEEKVKQIKISELPKLMKKAESQVTVGNMQNLLGENKPGFFTKLFCRIR